MDQKELHELLLSLIETWENEVIEFKEASNDYKTGEIAKYFSALANEANLKGLKHAWLVFGVCNKTRLVTGTSFRPDSAHLNSLKEQIKQITGSISFINILELIESE